MNFAITIILKLLGRFLASLPVCLVEGIGAFFGDVFYYGFSSRRHLIFSNLHHCFPDWPAARRRAVARESCRRMIEMALFSLASPYFSEACIGKMFSVDKNTAEGMVAPWRENEPSIFVTPHFSLMEALTLTPAIDPRFPKKRPIGVFYRPLGNAALDNRVKQTRERFGMKLLSRKAGFGEAMNILKNNGHVVVLFDQNAGSPGALSLFFDRVVSTSELAGLLAEKFNCRTLGVYVEHVGFWRGIIHAEKLCCAGTDAVSATIAANKWLEEKLRQDDNLCADWLWPHNRWKTQNAAHTRFRLQQKRNILPETLATRSLSECPRKERFWIHLPESFADTGAAIPLLRAFRRSRPDAETTLLAEEGFASRLKELNLAEKIIALPEDKTARKNLFRQLRNEYPDTYVLFPESKKADRDAARVNATQYFGILRTGKKRPVLTHPWHVPAELITNDSTPARLWECWFRSHGLEGEILPDPAAPQKSL